MFFPFKITRDQITVVITINFLLVMFTTILFSCWKVYSTNLWVDQVKEHINITLEKIKDFENKDTKQILENQEDIRKLLHYDEKEIIKNQTTFRDTYQKILENQKAILELKIEARNNIEKLLKNYDIILQTQERILEKIQQ